MKNRFWMLIAFAVMVVLGTPRLRAEEGPNSGVARISFIHGQVSTQRGDTGEWIAAAVNAPVVAGDKVSTGQDSRSELQLDYADILRLGSQTDAKIADLSQNHIQVQIAQGLADYTVLKGAEGNVEIDTPNVAVHPLEPGVYRIEVDSESQTKITVRKGRAQVSTPQGSANLNKNEMMTVEGTDNPQYQIVEAPGRDDWDKWNDQRDNVIENARSWQYANHYYTGAEDLDAYGHWVYVPGYDWCWTPYVNAGWIPYYDGRWAWEPYWGWTWVSYEPWGWAPYHYGRWFFYGNSWCWWPGPVFPAYRPIWAPAYVSFFGFGFGGRFHFGVGFGFGSIGWLPVGPCDPFYRWWGYRGGFNVVNVTNIRNVTNITNIRNVGYVSPLAGRGRPVYSNLQAAMVNARVRRAIVTVPSQQFAAGNVLHARRATITEAQLRQAQYVAGHVPVVPTRSSLRTTTRPASRGAIPSSAVSNRRFFTTHQPPAGPRPFNEQVASVQRMIQNNRPNTIDARGMTNGRMATDPASRVQSNDASRSAFSGNQQATQQGWRRLGAGSSTTSQPAYQRQGGASNSNSFQRNANQPAFSNNRQTRQGWRTFGASPSGRVSSNPSVRQGASANSGTRIYQDNRGVFRNAPAQSGREGWRSFGSGQNAGSGNRPEYRTRSFTPANQGMRTMPQNSFHSSPGESPARGARSGWQTFTPQPRQSFERSGAGFSAPRPQSNKWGWQSPSRSSGWGWASRGSYQKPPLEINKPIVNERSSGYGGGYRGYSSRSYSRPSSGGFSRSSGGGGYHGGGGGLHGGASSGGHGRR